MLQIHRSSKFILFATILFSAILGLLRFNSLQLGASQDDAHYIILAESLSSGQGYQLINFPHPQLERAFPPGWPILLTLPVYLLPGNFTVLKIITWILWLASLPLIHRLFAKRIESPYLEILIGLIALNPLLVGTSVTVMSESAYLFFSLIVLTVFDTWQSKADKTKIPLIVLMALLALYTQLIRTVGISISAALPIYFVYTRRFREAGIAGGVFVLGAILQAWLNLRSGGSMVSAAYETQVFNSSIIEKIGQMGANGAGYMNEVIAGSLVPIFGEKFTSFIGPLLPLLSNSTIILLLFFGLVLSFKKFELIDIYFVIYFLAILAFWNPKVGSVKVRFLIPILPFLYFYLIHGSRWVIGKLSGNHPAYAPRIITGLAGMIMLISLVRNLQDWHSPIRDQMTDLSIGADWISRNTPSDAIIMVNEPIAAYLYTQRKTLAYPPVAQGIEKFIKNQGVDYIIISPKLQSPRTINLDNVTLTKFLPLFEENPDRFILVYGNSEYNVSVYKYEESSSSQ